MKSWMSAVADEVRRDGGGGGIKGAWVDHRRRAVRRSGGGRAVVRVGPTRSNDHRVQSAGDDDGNGGHQRSSGPSVPARQPARSTAVRPPSVYIKGSVMRVGLLR